MRDISLDAIVSGYDPKDAVRAKRGIKKPKKLPVTFWIPAEAKEAFARLQKLTNKDFGAKAQEVLLALIESMNAKAG